MKYLLGLTLLTLLCIPAFADEASEPTDKKTEVVIDNAYVNRLSQTIEDAKRQAEFIQRACDASGAETPDAVSQLLEDLNKAAKQAEEALATALDNQRPDTNFEPEGPLVIRNIKPGEVIENVELNNVYLHGHLADGAVLRNVTIRNGGVGIYTSSDVTLSNVRVIGGHPEGDLQAGFSFSAVKNLKCHNLAAYDCQRGLYMAVNTSGSSTDFLFDGVVVDGYHNWLDTTNRTEALLVHGYDNGKNYSVQGTFKNVHVRNRGGSFTIWDVEVEDLLLESMHGVTKVHLGFAQFIQKCKKLDIKQAPDLQQVRFALYNLPVPAATLDSITAPGHTQFVVTKRNTQRLHLVMEQSYELDDIKAYLDDEFPQRYPEN